MSQFAPIPARAVRRVTGPALQSTALFSWQARFGSLTALTGQVGTLTRASTLAATDSSSTAYTAAFGRQAWGAHDWTGSGTRDTVGMTLGSSDRLSFPINWGPQAFGFVFEFVEVNTRASAGALFSIDDGSGNPYFAVFARNANDPYCLEIGNAPSFQAVTLATGPSVGQRCRLRGLLSSSGTVQLWQSIDGGAESSTAVSGAGGLPTSWGVNPVVRINTVFSASRPGSQLFRRLTIMPGAPTLAQLTSAL